MKDFVFPSNIVFDMFAKVFGQIFDSSIAEDYNCRRMFIDLLVLADSDGVVDMTQEAISRRTNVPIEQVCKYIDQLQQPDLLSRSKKENGRRLIAIDPERGWGWQVVNYRHYRQIRDEEARRSYFRDAKRKQRKEDKHSERETEFVYRNDGYIYYARNGDQIKIGYSNNPRARVSEMKVACPGIVLLAAERASQEIEGERHRQFVKFRIAGEWFKANKLLADFILTLPVLDKVLTQVDTGGDCQIVPSASASKSASACTQKGVEDFCESLSLPRSDGEAMFLHWQEKGPAKVKDWKATIRKWKSFGYLPSQKKYGTHQQTAAKHSRTTGTANERRIGQYDNVGKV